MIKAFKKGGNWYLKDKIAVPSCNLVNRPFIKIPPSLLPPGEGRCTTHTHPVNPRNITVRLGPLWYYNKVPGPSYNPVNRPFLKIPLSLLPPGKGLQRGRRRRLTGSVHHSPADVGSETEAAGGEWGGPVPAVCGEVGQHGQRTHQESGE